jgi:hypothetical protein
MAGAILGTLASSATRQGRAKAGKLHVRRDSVQGCPPAYEMIFAEMTDFSPLSDEKRSRLCWVCWNSAGTHIARPSQTPVPAVHVGNVTSLASDKPSQQFLTGPGRRKSLIAWGLGAPAPAGFSSACCARVS